MIKTYFQVGMSILLLAMLAACSQVQKQVEAIKPTASLVGVKLTNLNFDQAELVFNIEVKNDNPFSINLDSLDYDFKIADNSLVSGISNQEIKLKKSSISSISLPVTLKFDDLKKIPGGLRNADQLPYLFKSNLNVILPIIGYFTIPVEQQGELPVPKRPTIKFKRMKVENLTLSDADFIFTLEVYNPNAFHLGLSNFNYQLNINNQTWVKGINIEAAAIPQKGKGIINVPTKIDLRKVGSAVYSALANKDRLSYQLVGNITVDTGLEFLKDYEMLLNFAGTTKLSE